jgi:putative tryptophan/tyrosine transport system substrate-binding protein
MRRREFVTLGGGTALAWPLAARAQQPEMPVIGFLNAGSPAGYVPMMDAFRQGLKEAGYIEGQNVAIEYRWANDRYDSLAALPDDLVRRRVSVIVANTPANLVAKAATSTTPVVFTTGGDPVQIGLLASLSRPGRNVTGVTQLTGEVGAKRLALLHELVPAATVMALLVNPTDPALAESLSRETEAAARKLGLELHVLHASSESDFETVFEQVTQSRAGGLVVGAGAFFSNHSDQLAALSLRHLMPAIFAYRQFVAAGGLASYAGSITESYRLAGVYAGRILKGAKPADLPVQQSMKIELFINLKTAKALAITVPQTLLVAADEVIE